MYYMDKGPDSGPFGFSARADVGRRPRPSPARPPAAAGRRGPLCLPRLCSLLCACITPVASSHITHTPIDAASAPSPSSKHRSAASLVSLAHHRSASSDLKSRPVRAVSDWAVSACLLGGPCGPPTRGLRRALPCNASRQSAPCPRTLHLPTPPHYPPARARTTQALPQARPRAAWL